MVLFNLKKIFFYILFFSSVLSAQVYPDLTVDSLLKSGIKNLMVQDYSSAKKTFAFLEKRYPHIPLGKIYTAAAYITEAYDKAEPYDMNIINKNLEAANLQSESLLESDSKNVWNIYFHALVKGIYAYYDALNSNWFGALSGGLSCISNFEKCLEIDSSFYESFTAIGTYKYWRSRKTEFLNWLPFVDDEKDAGIDFLEKAVKLSNYNYYFGVYSLQWIYIDKGEPGKAVKISEKVLKEFPNSRFFKWGYARALQDINLADAIKVYYDILNSYPQKTNRYNEIFLKHLIAQFYVKLGENDKALKLCNEILAINNLSDFVLEKLGNRLDRVKALQKELLAQK